MKWIAVAAFVLVTVNGRPTGPSENLATAFLNGLTSAQKSEAQMSFADEARETWAYTPGQRAGVTLKELNEIQRKAALDLLRSSLSESGFKKVEAIRTSVEQTLRQLEGNPGRDPERFFIAVFGTPTEKGKWAWRFEGHHVSLSFTYVDGRLIATTPQFLGSNPANVETGPSKGLRVLGQEEDLGRAFVKSLSAEQAKTAIIAARAPADILTNNQRKAEALDDKGIEFFKLTDKQKTDLKALVKLFADVQKPDQAKERLTKIERAGWDRLKFVWMGGLEPGEGHYYRVQGTTFLIEYDNTQNGANHIHTVWRDFNGDFGRDALAEHYRTSPNHRH